MELVARVEIERAKVAASQQRFADAIDALKVALADSKDPALQAQIRSQLKQLRDTRDYNSAVTLANQGDRAGALVALNRLLPIVEDPGLRGLATDMRDRLAANEMSNDGAIAPPAAAQVPNKLKPDPDSARARALRREAQAQNEADRYNEAVALANHGKLKDALAITEDLAKNATNVTVKTAAAGLSDRLRARLAGTR
jgi:hypothetical protein